MLLRVLALAPAMTAAAPCLAQDKGEEGSVIWHDRRCAFFSAQSALGFTLFGYWHGPWPGINDVIEGKLDGFGMRNVINQTADNQTTVAYSEISSNSKKWVGGKIPGLCKRRQDLLARLEGAAPARQPAQQP